MRRRSWIRAERKVRRVDDIGTEIAIVGEVQGSQPVEELVDEQADFESHPTLNVKPMQLSLHEIGDG